MNNEGEENWLSRYANDFHHWRTDNKDGADVFRRRLGLVETTFYVDGRFFQGRADVTALITVETKTKLSQENLRHRILLAWTCLRFKHVLLMSHLSGDEDPYKQEFIIRRPKTTQEALLDAADSITFVDKLYQVVDVPELWRHCTNIGRIPNPSKNFSRLLILPPEKGLNGNTKLRFLQVSGHSITDGLSMNDWVSSFLELLNTDQVGLQQIIGTYCGSNGLRLSLPPAQEDLYTPITGSIARRRWFWAIIRILRHVRKRLPAAFPNPLYRSERRSESALMNGTYFKLFDYSREKSPPNNAFIKYFRLSLQASQRLQKLARSTGASIGAGCFALVGLAMMALEEKKNPGVSLNKRAPFIASFPLNPRPFFGHKEAPNSCMLAFSDGIVLPFLSSDLPIEGRLKLLSITAHRQLRRFQKRKRGPEVAVQADSPVRMVAQNYVTAVEQIERKLPPNYRSGVNPQGLYDANLDLGVATCGVSSMGTLKQLSKGKYALDVEDKDFAADFRDLEMGVRARQNEFLVGSYTESDGVAVFGVSFDGNAIDEKDFDRFERIMQRLLETDERARL